MLDRVIGRLAEVAIVPTPSLTLMRRAVRNIFHIVTDPFRDRPMLSSSRTCWRTSETLVQAGFNADPPFVFEPDDTRTNVAWVNGVDDPTVHIAAHHFYMDRQGAVVTMVHERAHTILRLPGHPGGIDVINDPADGVPTMTQDEAMRNAYDTTNG